MTAGWDKAVRLWDVSTGQSIDPPLFVQSLISSAAMWTDGNAVLVGCQDGTARIWSLATGKPISPTFSHNDVVKDVAFVPNHKAVATGSYDGTVRMWDHPDPVAGSVDESSNLGRSTDTNGAVAGWSHPASRFPGVDRAGPDA